jgi:N12 class adenine-specific DNA methylase
MLSSGESLKDFYRIAALNPHIELHDACQILVARPDADICFSFEEWNAMGRRIRRGSQGIKYYDVSGNKKYVFTEIDTHGDSGYLELKPTIQRMLDGLDLLNGKEITKGITDEYRRIYTGVAAYLIDNDYLTDDEQKNRLLCEGVSYSLYSKTEHRESENIRLRGLPYSLKENATVFKEIYTLSNSLCREIEKAYIQAQQREIAEEKTQSIVRTNSAVRSNYKGYDAFVKHIKNDDGRIVEREVYLGKDENYDNHVNYDNSDNSLILISKNPNIYGFLYGNGWVVSQQHFIENDTFTKEDYAEFNKLSNGILKQFECTKAIKFEINIDIPNSEVPFVYPDWQKETPAPKAQEIEPKPTTTPYYERYLTEQEKHPNDIVLIRLGDFYEAMNNSAIKVSSLLDLTLTGRNVGLPERVPMCGFPYHSYEIYLDKITEEYSVIVVENDNEVKRIRSKKEIAEEKDFAQNFEDNFSGGNEQDFEEDFSEEENEDEQFDDYSSDEDEEDFEDNSFDDDGQDFDETEKPKKVKQPQEKEKERKSIRDRKGKNKTVQPTLFDIFDEPKPPTPEEKLTEYILKCGSGVAGGKFRIYEQYFSDSTVKEFADFLKNEYGWGGVSSYPLAEQHDGKGITAKLRDNEHPENEIVVRLNWVQAANGIADLIDANNYLTEEERLEYEQYKAEKTGKPSDIQPLSNEYLQPQGKENEKPTAVNTDLNELEFDQSELGGAKARFRSNVEAILLVDKLYKQDRNPNLEEKKVLAKYVGWGGIPQVFDEHNEQWQSEYRELKSILSTEDYDRAKGSVLNAHYTSKEVIEGIYQALDRFGVKGNNRILEPAMGTGNFYGYMPKEIAENAKMYGVELDNITGKIAKKLYPNVIVQIKGFEETSFPNNHFDVVVSNVPFGNYSVYDSEYNKYNFHIHDYFIAKGIDKLKPNGIMAVITSKGTMDKLNPSVRKHIADRAELLGAIRLPNTAFRQTAGTQVTADILFFQKRGELVNSDDLWVYTNNNYPIDMTVDGLPNGYLKKAVTINSYFADRPEMMLGTLVQEHGLYGAIDITLNSDGRKLFDALSEAINKLPENIYKNPEYSAEAAENEEFEVDYDLKPLCFKAVNGKLYIRVGGSMVEQAVPKIPQNAYGRIVDMISLRQDLRHVLDIQSKGCSDEMLTEAQRKLNYKYDRFVRLFGIVNSQTNTRLFRDDGDSALLFAAENIDEDKKTATKADIFSKRTIRPYSVVTHTDDCFEALQISKNEKGKVDIAYIEELTKKDYDTVLKEIDKAIFRNPLSVIDGDKYSGFETAEEYLSGKVVAKLKTASQFVRLEKKPEFERNVRALEEVQPEPIKASGISARIGASWINKEYYRQFFCELLKINPNYSDGLELFYNPHDSSWRVDRTDFLKWQTSMNANQVYGTERASAYRLFEDCLNLKAAQIYDTVEEDGKTKRVLNHGETVAAREKQNKIKEAFKEWIFNDPERREDLENKYNGLFNQIRLPDYDGSYLKFPQMNPSIELKDHQKNAVHRTITSGNTLLHHVVGAGKTYTVCATAMKLRQYGLAKKPMIAVPNHLVQQWASEFRTLYPTANLLIANKEDLEKENRQKFISKVAMGDWDAVIIAQSSFAKIPISPERQAAKIREEISLIEETIDNIYDEGSMPRGAVKNLERIKKNKEAFLKKLMDGDKKDSLLTFESLGVDYLFVDEAHNYKNLFLYTKMNNVAGISTAASQRASDLQLKCEYINELHGGDKGVVFATGTPISNSMTEMYTMQTYLQKRALRNAGITYFDGWAADFGETVTSLEMAPSGKGYKAKTRFAKFTNLPELLTLYRSFADVQTADTVKLNVPEAERKVVTLKPSGTVLEIAEQIAERAERISAGRVDPSVDNMLKITSDGKKLALDARCFDGFAADEPASKLNGCADRVFGIWRDSTEIKGTQLVFCDLSTPKKAFEDYEYGKDFDVYNDLKYKLVQKSIPENEIAFIHDANGDMQKQSLFNNINDGKVRVLIGSTEKCGSGTNVQKRLIALHHLDTPYRPSDLAQREGRIVRQGNTNEKVQIFTYVTERTFDSYSYQILENKQRFIAQIDRGDLTVREADDIDETTLTYAEIKAITAANPMIKRKMEIDTEVTRLRILEGQFKKSLYGLQDKIRRDLPEQIRKQTLYSERIQEDIVKAKQNYNPEVFSISVLGTTYTDKKDGGKALTDAFTANKTDTVIAEYCGFKLSLNPLVLLTEERSITIAGSGQYTIDIGASPSGNMTRLDNFLEDLPQRAERVKRKLIQIRQDLEIAKVEVTKPFEHAERLTELIAEQAQINAELDLNKREEVVIDDGGSGEDGASGEDELHTGLSETKTSGKTRRKPLTNEMRKIYEDITAKSPEDAYLFMQNGGRYEVIGEQAKTLANDYKLPLIEQETSGEKISVVSLEVEKMDKIIGKLVEKGSQIRIIEPFIQKREENTIINGNDKDNDKENNFDELFNDNEGKAAKIKQYIPIYTQSAVCAREHGELEQFRTNENENRTCKQEIERAINENYENNHLKKGLEAALIEKFGLERISYVLANTLQQKEWDGRFSRENKEWARSIPVYDNNDRRNNFVVDTHSVLTDAFISRFREALKQPQEERQEKATETAKEKTAWLKVNIAKEALIKKYDDTSFMRMPKSKPEYADYTYNLYNSRIKESTQIYDLQSDSREPCLQVLLKETDNIRLTNKKKETLTLTAREFYEIVGGTTSKDYRTKQSDGKQWFSVNMPEEAMLGSYDDSSLFQMPNKPETAGFSFYVPNALISRDGEGESGRLTVRLPEDFEITARNKAKGETLKLTAYTLYDFCNDTDISDFAVGKSADGESGGGWNSFGVPRAAKITEYGERTLFKMPKGELENFFYYIPDKLVKENGETGVLQFNLPNDFIVRLTDNKNGEKVELSLEQFLKEVKDKTEADYTSNFYKPSESKANKFAAKEKEFTANVPDEMKDRPNWCIVRTKENAEKGRLEKFLIDCHTGKAAEIDNPSTWTDFKTACEYAKKNGGETLAYALDGKDKICCIDLDYCIDEKGNHSDLAIKLMTKSRGTYTEHSISGKGVHIFGKTDGLDVRAFARDGDLEFYQNGRFIAMTGDVVGNSKELLNLDKTAVKTVLEEKCAKRTELKGAGQGIEGLSSMSDRDVVEKAISSKGGETFKALYNGQNLQNNHSNSDMSLMNRLAFWTNGDKEQMLRVFATSGLYRPNKSINYYEHSVIKAIQDTTSRYQPQSSKSKPTENKKPNNNGGNGKA